MQPDPTLAAPRPRAARPPPSLDVFRAQVRAYEPVTREYAGARLPVVEGALPPALRGVLYRNGPGRFEFGGVTYGHPFDGDGMVTRFAFEPDGVRYTNRYVRTREFVREAAAGRLLYRSFGTNRPGGLRANILRLAFKNAANTSVVWHGGALLALWEGGLPHRLDPVTLETLARHDYDGALRERGDPVTRWLAPELPFSAHPRRDVATGELFNFGTAVGRTPRLMLYRVSPAGRMDPPTALPLAAQVFAHDFVLTARWRVFLLPPVAFRLGRTLLGLQTPVDSLREVPGAPTRVLLVPRDGGPAVHAAAPPGFVFHFANGFDAPDGTVVLDVVRHERYPDLLGVAALRRGAAVRGTRPRMYRLRVDPRGGGVQVDRVADYVLELPTVHPAHAARPHRFAWSVAAPADHAGAFLPGLVKTDSEQGAHAYRDFGDGLPGEPVLAPRPGATDEDDGWVLATVYVPEHHRTDLLVLRAADLATECRLALPHHVPPGFHGAWVPTG